MTKGTNWRRELPMAAWTGDFFTPLRLSKAMQCDCNLKFNAPRVQWRAVSSQ
jgi:hypothetical protein